MKAIIYHTYGPPDVLKCEEVEKPSPGEDEVLIKVHAASANPLDWHFMRGEPYFLRMMAGLRNPKITRLGVDVAGQVEAVGRNVTQFKPGDAVFGSCRGAFAEYACTAASKLARKPDNVTFEQAAAAPAAALTALQALRRGGLSDKGQTQPGQKILIHGAAGGVGTFAVQIAKSFGADVTGVCSTRNVEMVRSLGADRVIDYTQQDFTEGAERYDLILDCIGDHSLAARRRVMKPKGICVMIGFANIGRWIGSMVGPLKAIISSLFSDRKFVMFVTKLNRDDLEIVRALMETGKLTSVIDRRYELSKVPEAIRYLEEGHARGKVVITFG